MIEELLDQQDALVDVDDLSVQFGQQQVSASYHFEDSRWPNRRHPRRKRLWQDGFDEVNCRLGQANRRPDLALTTKISINSTIDRSAICDCDLGSFFKTRLCLTV